METNIYYTKKDCNNNGQNQLNKIKFDYFSLFTYGLQHDRLIYPKI